MQGIFLPIFISQVVIEDMLSKRAEDSSKTADGTSKATD